MIDFLRGVLALRELEYVVLDVHGIGYRVFCSNPFGLPFSEGQEGTLFIHYHVREDAHLLFGFGTREEQSLFKLLLEVSGIGPKVALGVLAGGTPANIIGAIRQENLTFLTKLPGIGRKTAQRMVLDLKDKLGASPAGLEGASLVESGGIMKSGSGGAWGEAKEALMALGYTEAETDRAWHAIQSKVKETDAVDAVMKLALQALYTM
jgi:holliday junction DNA helicase RuvA